MDISKTKINKERGEKEEEKKNLRHCHNVRHHTLGLEPPKVAPCASEPTLNLISNTKASCFLYTAINRGQVTRGQFYNPSHSLHK
jgi:hypothetical protein